MSRSLSFDSPDVEKDFPGLYMSDKRPEEVPATKFDPAEEFTDKLKLKKDLLKKDKRDKDKKKDKGYVVFEEENSDDERARLEEMKSPNKLKKHSKPSFKFAKKEKFVVVKKDKDDRSNKDKDKDKRKEDYKEKKTRTKKKTKLSDSGDECKPIFGVPLSVAVARNRCYDGVELPALVRECIDYIEEHGLSCEGIYRISGVKSKVQALKDAYNKGRQVQIFEHEPNVVASLLKQFLRELPEPVLTIGLMTSFEEASTIKDQSRTAAEFRRLIQQLPVCNRLLLSWIILHMLHVIAMADQNKMTLQNVSIVLSPTMQISHRVLNVLFHNANTLFADSSIKRYVPPLKPATSKWSLELPDQPVAIEEELDKQEALLNQLHAEINAGLTDSDKEEQLWEVQRIVTQLKRKLKTSKKSHTSSLNTIDDDIVLNLALATESQPTSNADVDSPAVGDVGTAAVTSAVSTDAVVATSTSTTPVFVANAVNESSTATTSGTEIAHAQDKTSEELSREGVQTENENRVVEPLSVENDTAAIVPATGVTDVTAVTNDVSARDGATSAEAAAVDRGAQDIHTGPSDRIVADVISSQLEPRNETLEPRNETLEPRNETLEPRNETLEPRNETLEPGQVDDDDVFEGLTPVAELVTSSRLGDFTEPTDYRPVFQKTDSIDSSRELADIITPTDESQPIVAVQVPSRHIVFRPIRDDESSYDDTEEVIGADQIISGAVRPVAVPPHSLPISEQTTRFDEPKLKRCIVTGSTDSAQRTCDWNATTQIGGGACGDTTPPPAPPRNRHGLNQPYLQSPLKPEILHKRLKQQATSHQCTDENQNEADDELDAVAVSPVRDDSGDDQDEEYKSLVYQHQMALLEEEELLAIGTELRKKIEAERDEMERLQQEIVEVRSMRECDSDDDEAANSSDSDRESGDEDELSAIVQQLHRDNERLERENHELVKKIDVERQICLDVKVQIRMIQQQAERYCTGTDSLL